MSWEQPAYRYDGTAANTSIYVNAPNLCTHMANAAVLSSFGNPNAQPLTPTQTPTSAVFRSPTLQTPRNSSSFDDHGGWTPQFAEEYSVFNATPGRLISTQLPLVDISTPRPSTSSSHFQPVSGVDDIAEDLSSHAHHLSAGPSVDPANRLSSSPDPHSQASYRANVSPRTKSTPVKPKSRLQEAFSGQTATPPRSASKRTSKIAAKGTFHTMQHEPQDTRYGGSEIHDQSSQLMMSFAASTSSDLFSYPLTAPATAPIYGENRSFWDPDTGMDDMGMDFSMDQVGILNSGSQRPGHSFDWTANDSMYQDNVVMAQQQEQQQQQQQQQHQQDEPTKRQRPLASKSNMPNTSLPTSVAPMQFDASAISGDSFTGLGLSSAVDPVLLFSQNASTARTMSSEFEDVSLPPARPSTGGRMHEPYQHQLRESRRDMEELRRSRSTRERSSSYRIDRTAASSPVKSSARPGMQRSHSESHAKGARGR